MPSISNASLPIDTSVAETKATKECKRPSEYFENDLTLFNDSNLSLAR